MIFDLFSKPMPFNADDVSIEGTGNDAVRVTLTFEDIHKADHESIDITVEEARKLVQSKVDNRVMIFQALSVDYDERVIHVDFTRP